MSNFNEPLGLPQGSVRALIALAIVLSAIAGILLGRADVALTGAAQLIIGYYFGSRTAETKGVPKAEPIEDTTYDSDTEPEQEERQVVPNK